MTWPSPRFVVAAWPFGRAWAESCRGQRETGPEEWRGNPGSPVKRYEKWSFRAGKPMNTIWKLDKNGALELRFFFNRLVIGCHWVFGGKSWMAVVYLLFLLWNGICTSQLNIREIEIGQSI